MAEPESVTIVVSGLLPTLGLAAATLALANALCDRYNVSVIYLSDDERSVPTDVRFPIRSWGSKVGGLARIITVPRALRHRSEMGQGVLILSGVWTALPILLTMPKSARNRVIVWEHSLGNENVKSHRRLVLLRAAAKKLYPRSLAVVAVSDSLRKELISAGFQGEITVIPNLAKPVRHIGGQQRINGRLLTIGSLKRVKNQELALRSLALLPPKYSMDIVGDGPDLEFLQRLAVQLGVRDRVAFHGHVSDPETYFARAEVVVHPSLGETYGMVFFESAEFERPVVAANQSVMPDLIPRLVPGRVADPVPEAFAAAILSLESEPVEHEAFVAAAQQRKAIADGVPAAWERLISEAVTEAARTGPKR